MVLKEGIEIKKKYISILGSYFFAEYGKSMYLIVTGWLIYDLTKDPLYTGILVSMGFLPNLFFNLVIGVVADRFNRQKLALLANLISTLDMIVIFSLIYLGIVKPWMIIGVHMLLQVMGSLFRISMQTYISEGFDKEELPEILSKSGAAAEIGALVGAATAGIIIAYISMRLSMFVVIISFVSSTFLVYLTRLTVKKQVKSKISFLTNFIDGFIYLKKNKFLFGLFSISAVGQMVFHSSTNFLPVYTREFLNKSTVTLGFLDATISIGGILAGIVATLWWKKNGKSVIIRSLFIIIVGLISTSFSPNLSISFLGVFLIGLGTTWVRVYIQTIQQISTDPSYRGRISSYRILFNQGSMVISGPILGWIASKYGVNIIYLVLFGPTAFIVIYSFLQSRQRYFLEITESVQRTKLNNTR